MSILDFAGASQATVSFVTNYGHRLYSDDFVRQLDQVFAPANGANFFENQANPILVSDFFNLALSFEDASFDGALVWDSLQFLASPLLQTVVAKLHGMLRPGASLLALFNTEERIESIATYAYRIQDHRTIRDDRPRPSASRMRRFSDNRSLRKDCSCVVLGGGGGGGGGGQDLSRSVKFGDLTIPVAAGSNCEAALGTISRQPKSFLAGFARAHTNYFREEATPRRCPR